MKKGQKYGLPQIGLPYTTTFADIFYQVAFKVIIFLPISNIEKKDDLKCFQMISTFINECFSIFLVFVAFHSIFSFNLLQVHQKCLHTSFIGHNHDNSFGSVPSWIIGSQRDQVLSVSIKASQCVALQKKK